MRPSYYNVVAPDASGEGTVLFNTLSGNLAKLSPSEQAVYDRIAEIGPTDEGFTVVEELASAGFALENPEDEAEYLHWKFEQTKFNTRVFELYIAPTLDCNFSCVYCYEHKRPGRMSLEVEKAVCSFVEEQYASAPFKELKIVWYGGEPLLCMDTIERLSESFLAFVKDKGIDYYASIITNGVLADEKVREQLEKCQVWCVMATLDGQEGVHERTRRACNGQPSYKAIRENIDGFLDRGMSIDLRCVVEQGNVESCLALADEMSCNDKVGVRFNQMRDMTDWERQHPDAGDFKILSPQMHAEAVLREFLQRDPQREDFEDLLRPLPVHCSTSIDREYNIDERGNAYACSGVVGLDEYVLFNILDPPERRSYNRPLIARYGNYNPLDFEQCRSCQVLPLCMGGCTHQRMLGEPVCNPMRYIVKDLISAYGACCE